MWPTRNERNLGPAVRDRTSPAYRTQDHLVWLRKPVFDADQWLSPKGKGRRRVTSLGGIPKTETCLSCGAKCVATVSHALLENFESFFAQTRHLRSKIQNTSWKTFSTTRDSFLEPPNSAEKPRRENAKLKPSIIALMRP